MSKEQFHAAKSLPLAVAIGRFPQEVTRIACSCLDRCPALGIMSFSKSALPYKQSLTGPAVRCLMRTLFRPLWFDDQGQDIAEYAVMLAVILVPVVGTIRLIGSNTNNVFSQVGSSLDN